jgi:glycosyltransferase involved in cell wall biosynthesis
MIIDGLQQGGAERQALNTTTALVRQGCDVRLIYYHPRSEREPEYEPGDGLAERVVCLPKRRRPLRFVFRLARYLREGRFDVVHSFKSVPTIYAYAAGRLARTPVILGGCQEEYSDRGVIRQAHRLIKHRIAGWIANAECVRDSLVRELGLDPARCHVVPNGVDPVTYRSSLTPAAARERLGLEPGVSTVTIVAGLRPIKNHVMFLDVAALMGERWPAVRFLVAGGGELRGDLESRTVHQRLGERVHFLGPRADVPDILAATDVAVLTSHSEGLPNALLEAMAAGIPVVTTDYAGSRDLLTDGVEGFIVPRGDTATMACRIGALIEDRSLRGRMGANGAALVARRFTMDRMGAGFMRVYADSLQALPRPVRA